MKPKTLLLVALGLIASIFLGVAIITYDQFSSDYLKKEMSSQQKMSRIVNQSMNRYFETLRFIAENATLQPAFDPERTASEDALRFRRVDSSKFALSIKKHGIKNVLSGPRSAIDPAILKDQEIENWRIFKGLPEYDESGELIARERRSIARNILKSFKDIHYVFEMDPNGDLVFLEPFEIQKNVTSFNYEFRDYLRLVKSSRSTAISEGYISHDQNRTQIITIASPIFDNTGKVANLFAVSVSAATLRERVFRSLKENMDLQDGTTFSLVDRHGHIVASSSGKDIYFPTEGSTADDRDAGNLRSMGFFKTIDWTPDVLEKGNVWERKTMSWLVSSIGKNFSGQYRNLNGVEVFATFFPTSIIGSESTNWGILTETPIDQLFTSEKYVRRVFYIAGSVLAIILFALSFMTFRNFGRLEGQIFEKEKEVIQIASQVAHDIRSPLAALEMVVGGITQLPEDKRLIIRSATSRISDIANSLLSKNLSDKEAGGISGLSVVPANVNCQLISSILNTIITEKRLECRARLGVEIGATFDASSYGLFAFVDATGFKRVVSNLLNNAVEAIDAEGRVEVQLNGTGNLVELVIRDTGRGISPEVLPFLMKKGSTFGKCGGSGLGLYHAKETVESWGGSISIESHLNQGTIVIIRLPRAQAPRWFVPELLVRPDTTVAILDDDTSIHQIWRGRFEALRSDRSSHVELCHFSQPKELIEWLAKRGYDGILFLIDYELLDGTTNGLAVIRALGIASQSILVTSRYEERVIRDACEQLGVKLIPKGMAGFVPIRLLRPGSSVDAVLVDDDPLVQTSWLYAAKRENKHVKCFTSGAAFEAVMNNYDRDTPVFVDSTLGNGIKGEVWSKKLHDAGFKKIFLATGYAKDQFETDLPIWIQGVVGKKAPWGAQA